MTSSTPRRVDLTQKVPVRIQSIFNKGKGALMNVSATGAYVATPMYLLPQARVKLQIVLREERRWVEAEAIVVWENRGTVGRRDNLPPGYGLRFVVVPKDTEAVLDDLLSGNGAPPTPTAIPTPTPASAPAPAPQPAAQRSPAETLEPGAPNPLAGLAVTQEVEPQGPPYRLKGEQVVRHTPDATPGVFVLSYDRTQEALVGRADIDLRTTIAGFEGEYAYFYCEPIDDLEERYARECELFHRLGGDRGQLDNSEHPRTPTDTELECPVCVHEKVR